MEELYTLILNYFKKSKKSYTKEELKKLLNIKGEMQTNIFDDVLNKLIEDGCLFFDGKKYEIFRNELGIAYGEIEINKSGNGFVCTKDGYRIFIEQKDLNGALNGDKVIIDSIINGRKADFKGKVNKVLKRKNGKVLFEVIGNGYNASLIPYNKYENINIDINKNKLKNLIDGEIISVNVSTEMIYRAYKAEVDKVVGHRDDPNIDVNLLLISHNVPTKFSNDALEEAERLKKEVTDEDIKGRVDLRKLDFFTIDCDNTKDRDDAVYVKKLENGNYKLIVSIADVNHYIKRKSKLFEEAKERCNSYYINNTCNPMFPHIISNGICSLNENADRLTKSCEMEINSKGEIINYKVYKSIINSRKAMKYSECNKVLNDEDVNGYEKYTNSLKLMDELSEILSNAREERNYLDFDIPDVDIIQDSYDKAIDFKQGGIGKAQKIIENFMVAANESVAKNYSWFPFIYRIHESPNEQLLKDIIKTLRISGFNIPKTNEINEYNIKNILKAINDNDPKSLIARKKLLQGMKRAKYDTNNIGHFALQLKYYCHFTSPIRRIADFMVHTIIDDIENFDYSEESIKNIEKELKEISDFASKAERLADELDNEGKNMLMAEYMEKHIGETFETYITEVYKHGMFVETNNMISGKIKFEDMTDDKYYYDDDRKAIIGKNTKKKYRIGDKVYAIAKDASKINRTINFEFGKQKSLRNA